MSLADLIRGARHATAATATPATSATHAQAGSGTVARVATVAVAAAAIPAHGEPFFAFVPLSDPDSDREAIEERAGIIAEGCGMDPAHALQEARWASEREWAWRAFLRNAQRILEAPETARTGLLDRYRAKAASRYGETAAQSMARTMAGWIAERET